MKTFLSKSIPGKVLLTGAFSCVFALAALAQTTNTTTQVVPDSVATGSPTKAIGPAPANTPQNDILDGALSSKTRRTLQEAMNSVPAASTAHPAPQSK